jgi:hypothetical protein
MDAALDDLARRLKWRIWRDVADQAKVVEAKTQLRQNEVMALSTCGQSELQRRFREKIDSEQMTAPATSLAGLESMLSLLASTWRGKNDDGNWKRVGAVLDPGLEGLTWPLDGRAWDVEVDLHVDGTDLYLTATAIRPA